MIQIQSSTQFSRAAERLTKERMGVRRSEAHMYEVTNKAKGTRYHVRLTRLNGSLFIGCDCPAGTRHGKAPMVCKHMAATIITLRGIQEMRRQAAAVSEYDGND
jgi:uncharacterized Zn finger protein